MEETVDYVGMMTSSSSGETKNKRIRFAFFEVDLFLANMVFACLTVVGQVGVKVSLPLWLDSTAFANTSDSSNHSLRWNKTFENQYQPQVDGYFVLVFSSFAFAVIFGIALLFKRICRPEQLEETERRFPHLQLFLIGLCNALNGVLVVFASNGSRTPLYLQAILGNFLIPLVIGFRFLILRKVPTLRKFICALVVLVSIFICLTPKIFTEINPEVHDSSGVQSGPGRYLWPLCFMVGYMPAALMIVLGEKSLKMDLTGSGRRVSLILYLFWTSAYQLLVAVCLFWADLLPEFGYTDSINHFWDNFIFGFQCFFGDAGCTSSSGVRGTMFILMFVVSYFASASLMRHSEGASFLAIVHALVTPLGFIFWTLFSETPFGWHPETHITTWFSVGGLVFMVPAIFFYNISGDEANTRETVEHQPLLPDKNSDIVNYS